MNEVMKQDDDDDDTLAQWQWPERFGIQISIWFGAFSVCFLLGDFMMLTRGR